MFLELRNALRPALTLLLVLAAITGLAFPALITGIAQVAMPGQANGSLVRDGNRIIGSRLIAQGFTSPRYFHPRPSAAGKGYDASSSAGTNLAPASKDLRDAIAGRIKDLRAEGYRGAIPADLVTTSGSGLDPHISPEGALAQIHRIAAARGLSEARLRNLVATATENPIVGLVGEPRVNVLMLNRQLDGIAPNSHQ